ncbi:MAG: peptidylprolyl isomerase [Planctomycetes bacterium]|nr:peptidylprolyl isomerase [Planctomycetota bacterium]
MARHWLFRCCFVMLIAAACLWVGFEAGAQRVPEKGEQNSLKPGQVIRVGDKIITGEELIARIWDFEAVLPIEQRVLEPSMSYLRDTALLDLEAKRLELTLSDDIISGETQRQIDAIKQMVKERTRGMMTYEEWIKQQGLDQQGFEVYVRDRARIIVLKRVLVRYFEETEPSLEGKHILVKTLDLATNLHQRLKKTPKDKLDEVFEDLAVLHSIDPGAGVTRGKLPRIYENDDSLVKPAADALWELKDGEFSEPVKTDYGYHIFKRDRTLTPKRRPLGEMKNELLAAKDRANEEDYFNRWVRWVFNTQKYVYERRLPGYDCKPNQ